MNTLRVGKILQAIDMLAFDCFRRYVEDMDDRSLADIYFTTIALSGLDLNRRLTAD